MDKCNECGKDLRENDGVVYCRVCIWNLHKELDELHEDLNKDALSKEDYAILNSVNLSIR
jgi:uncharacterized Zn finger protein (UPF0148 family)